MTPSTNDPLRDRLHQRLDALFERYHVVVWRDDSSAIGRVLREPGVLPADVSMPEYQGNPLSLRAPLDSDDPWIDKKWLLYVPALPEGVNCEWLTDYEQGFCRVADGSLASCLHVFFGLPETPELRAALVGPAAAELATRFAEYFPGAASGLREGEVLGALLRAAVRAPKADLPELLLRYVTSPGDREAWDAARLLPTLTTVIREQLGLGRHLTPGQAPDLGALCRCMVASALVKEDAADARPLSNHLPNKEHRETWVEAVRRGLNDPERRSQLVDAIEHALDESDLPNALDNPERLAHGPPLALLDRRIERLLLERRPAEAGVANWCQEVFAVAGSRLSPPKGLDPVHQARWQAIRAAADLLFRARRRLSDLETYPTDAFDRLAKEYVDPAEGDHLLDSAFRQLPQAEEKLGHEWAAALIQPAQHEYYRWVRALTGRFTKALVAKGRYTVPGFIAQTEFWETMVEGPGRVAVLCVDALRADLASDLARTMEARGRAVLPQPALAALPSRTEVGMAALLPRANGNFAVEVEDGKLVSYIDGTRLPTVQERKRHLTATLEQQKRAVERRPLEDFLDNNGALLTACFANGALPVAATTDIDEGGPIATKADFGFFQNRLDRCAHFVDLALSAGFTHVAVGSDHGFVVRDPQAAKGGVSGIPPSAGGFAKGFRYAAGNIACGPALVHLPAKLLGRGGADVFVPQDDGYIEIQGGPSLFLHGGLSPQECAIVFLRVLPGKQPQVKRFLTLRVRAPERVTSLGFKVTIAADAIAEPVGFSGRKVLLRVFDAQGTLAWESPAPETFYPGPATTKDLMPKVPRGGDYQIALVDAESSFQIQVLSVNVEVVGGGFEF